MHEVKTKQKYQVNDQQETSRILILHYVKRFNEKSRLINAIIIMRFPKLLMIFRWIIPFTCKD